MSATAKPRTRTRTRKSYPCACCGCAFTLNPSVIHPWYTGRDKGLLRDGAGVPLTFFNAGHAWAYVFSTAQPNDARAKDNYRVLTLAQYEAGG